jgi:hypothetical protein
MHPIILPQPPSHLAGSSNQYADTDYLRTNSEKARDGYELRRRSDGKRPTVN